jgi:uncharacterized membrane protein YphA (DoxX/SURF4 family)
MKALFATSRILLGCIFLVFGLNGFFHFMPTHSPDDFTHILTSSGYMYFVKSVEVIGAVLLLINRYRVLALILLGADISNIAAYHLFVDRDRIYVVPILVVLYTIVCWSAIDDLKLLLSPTAGKPRDPHF